LEAGQLKHYIPNGYDFPTEKPGDRRTFYKLFELDISQGFGHI
jgi:hypothetical protein